MARAPERKLDPHPLDAKLIPVKHALIARAVALSNGVLDTPAVPEATEEQAMIAGVMQAVRATVAAELLALAEELHYW